MKQKRTTCLTLLIYVKLYSNITIPPQYWVNLTQISFKL